MRRQLAGVPNTLTSANEKDLGANVAKLSERGFRQPAEAAATIQRWFAGSYRSLRGELAREHLADLVPLFIDRLVTV